jgi:hypothetical protein
MEQTKTLEEENRTLILENEDMKIKFDKLHALTHGKLKKSSMA